MVKKQKPNQDLPEEIKTHIDEIERHIFEIKQKMFVDRNVKSRQDLYLSDDGQIVEGVFNGEAMVDQNKNIHEVPANYASKSRLVVGDKLKLIITADGRHLYKQIGPVDRKHAVGKLMESAGKYWVKVGNKKYRVLHAAVTYLKANVGDNLSIILPGNIESNWAAIENRI